MSDFASNNFLKLATVKILKMKYVNALKGKLIKSER